LDRRSVFLLLSLSTHFVSCSCDLPQGVVHQFRCTFLVDRLPAPKFRLSKFAKSWRQDLEIRDAECSLISTISLNNYGLLYSSYRSQSISKIPRYGRMAIMLVANTRARLFCLFCVCMLIFNCAAELNLKDASRLRLSNDEIEEMLQVMPFCWVNGYSQC
jgi:hypothetical protein